MAAAKAQKSSEDLRKLGPRGPTREASSTRPADGENQGFPKALLRMKKGRLPKSSRWLVVWLP